MIHVSMREQDQVRRRDTFQAQGGRGEALEAERQRAETQAHAVAENRVGQDGEAFDFEENGAVAEPGGVQATVGPPLWRWMFLGIQDWAPEFARVLLPEGGRGPVGERPERG